MNQDEIDTAKLETAIDADTSIENDISKEVYNVEVTTS